MKFKLSTIQGLLMLSLFISLGYSSYYIVRTSLITYATNSEGLNIGIEQAYHYFGYLSMALSLLPLPLGILSDFTFKQEKGVLYGGVIALLGYLLLLEGSLYFLIGGLIIVVIGLVLIKTNLMVLVGRLYDKQAERRNWGFLFYFTILNFATFFSVLGMGFLEQQFSWRFPIAFAAFLLLMLVGLSVYFQNRFSWKEKDLELPASEEGHIEKETTPLLPLMSSQGSLKNKVILLISLSLFSIIFEICFSLGIANFSAFLADFKDLPMWPRNLLVSLPEFIYLTLSLFFLIFWFFRSTGSSWKKMALALLMVGMATAILSSIPDSNKETFTYIVIPAIGLLELGELFTTVFLVSYLSRFSPNKYSSTMMGGYIFVSFAIHYLNLLPMEWWIALAIILGFSFFIFREKLVQCASGLK